MPRERFESTIEDEKREIKWVKTGPKQGDVEPVPDDDLEPDDL